MRSSSRAQRAARRSLRAAARDERRHVSPRGAVIVHAAYQRTWNEGLRAGTAGVQGHA
jgi:hypothetical protein